jgi:D-lactate dehydrogenase (cytochrome)
MLPSPSPPLMARAATIESVRRLLSDRLSTDLSVRERHGKDTSYLVANPPDAVAFPHSTEEVSAIVKICAEHKTPIIPFGAGTGVEGHILALCGGICIDLSGMNRILRVSTGDLDATVEAGVTHEQLNEHLSDKNLFFPVDPGATPPLAEWRQRELPARTRSGTAPCAKMCSHSRWCYPMAGSFGLRTGRENLRLVMI